MLRTKPILLNMKHIIALLLVVSVANSAFSQTDRKRGTDDNHIDTTEAYVIVKHMPVFKYRKCTFTEYCLDYYVADSLRLPSSACTGKVIVRFVVERDGSIGNIVIMSDESQNCPGIIQEIERMLKHMPRWTPGKINDVAVRVYYPMAFFLGQ